MSEENALPDGWVWTRVGEIYDIVGGGTPSTNIEEYWKGNVPWVSSADIYGLKDIRPRRLITKAAIEKSATNLVPEGSLIVVTRVGLGKVALAKMPICFSQDSQALVGNCSSIYPDYSLYYLAQAVQVFKYQSRGTTIAGVTKKQLAELPFSLPPLAEQYRIVAEVEEQLTRLDAGVAALKRTQAKLKRYRAAVLKAAVEGKLTETWRAEHPTTEPASMLLERILQERRAKWEADLRAKGKDPAKMKYVEPTEPDTESLPELPEGWWWVTVEQVSQCIVDCLHSTPKFKESGFLCIDTNCIKPGRIVFEKVRYVDEDTFIERNRRMKPKENDVMFSREGALLGVSVRVPSNLEFCLGQRMMIFRLDQCIDASFYEKVLNSSVFRSQYLHEITGSASPHLNIQDIRRFMIPLPPFVEQQIVVAEVERRLSIVEKLESVTEANLKRAERLRQSILKEAFVGRLVPQVSNDEPASVLLERIRKEREGQKKGIVGNGLYAKVSSKPVQIDVEGTRQVELWEGVGEGG